MVPSAASRAALSLWAAAILVDLQWNRTAVAASAPDPTAPPYGNRKNGKVALHVIKVGVETYHERALESVYAIVCFDNPVLFKIFLHPWNEFFAHIPVTGEVFRYLGWAEPVLE